MTKRLFVAATRQNDGKTMTALGLYHALNQYYTSCGYIKPVGQSYRIVDGHKIDKDAVLFSKVYPIKDALPDMSPIAIPPGFTEDFIENGNPKELQQSITTCFNKISKNKEFVLIEGTGHAGVGNVIGVSNATVAHLLESSVILVCLGGIGRSIDEVMLNKASFDQMGVTVSGVIVNKVRLDKYEKVNKVVRKGLEKMGLNVYGVVPFSESLTVPSVTRLRDCLEGEWLTGEECGSKGVQKIMIGDMIPHHALDQFEPDTLLIVPADREGLIMTAICGSILGDKLPYTISGIIFTGGYEPKPQIMSMLNQSSIPTFLVTDDSFEVATKINNMLLKVEASEADKVSTIQKLVQEYVDVDRIVEDLK